MAEVYKKHCLNCRKFSNHRHTPALPQTACKFEGCGCRYFYGWEEIRKKRGISKEKWAEYLEKKKKFNAKTAFKGSENEKPILDMLK